VRDGREILDVAYGEGRLVQQRRFGPAAEDQVRFNFEGT
jgi:hypothetical protein